MSRGKRGDQPQSQSRSKSAGGASKPYTATFYPQSSRDYCKIEEYKDSIREQEAQAAKDARVAVEVGREKKAALRKNGVPQKKRKAYVKTFCPSDLRAYQQCFLDVPPEDIVFSILGAYRSGTSQLRAVTAALEPALAVGERGTFLKCDRTQHYKVLRSCDDMQVVDPTDMPNTLVRFVSFGSVWQLGKPMAKVSMLGLAENGSWVVAVGQSGRILRSESAVDWVPCYTPTKQCLNAVHFAEGRWVAVGDGVICTAGNPKKWRLAKLSGVGHFKAVAYGQGVWLACGECGCLVRSMNGETWEALLAPVSTTLYAIAYAFGRFFVAGEHGVIASSEHGDEWRQENSQTTVHLRSVCVTPRGLMAVGDCVLFSVDGADWKPILPIYQATLHCVCWTGLKCIAVGDQGTIIDILPGPWIAEPPGDS
jgi:hypothetical protein